MKHQCEGYVPDKVCVRIAGIGELPSRFGDFHVFAFYNNRDDKEHAAIVSREGTGAENIPVRVHSECLTVSRPLKAAGHGHANRDGLKAFSRAADNGRFIN